MLSRFLSWLRVVVKAGVVAVVAIVVVVGDLVVALVVVVMVVVVSIKRNSIKEHKRQQVKQLSKDAKKYQRQHRKKAVSMHHPTRANYLSTSFVAEAERAKTQEGVKSKSNTKRQQKAASETAMQGSKRITNTAQGKTVDMHHPTQANYLSTSFVAEVERAKTQEGVKSNRRFKRKQKAASDIAKQGRKTLPHTAQIKNTTHVMHRTAPHFLTGLTNTSDGPKRLDCET